MEKTDKTHDTEAEEHYSLAPASIVPGRRNLLANYIVYTPNNGPKAHCTILLGKNLPQHIQGLTS